MTKNVFPYIHTKKMHIWNVQNIKVLLMLGGVIIQVFYLNWLLVTHFQQYPSLLKYIVISIAILVAVIIFFGFHLRGAVQLIRNYNFLIENGMIVFGNMKQVRVTFLGNLKASATFFDEETGHMYFYLTEISGFWGGFEEYRLRYYGKKDSKVRILVDPNNMNNGYILLKEYYKEKKGLYGDELFQKSNYNDMSKFL